MTGTKQRHRPLLFLDVDGPLIPFGATPEEYPTYQAVSSPHLEENPLISRINPAHGKRLLDLDCELVWATSWMDEANECIAPCLGLPQLPIVTWPDTPAIEEQDARNGLHWKTRTLVAWAAGRPFAWLDDEITDNDRTWVSAHHPGQALLHRVNPKRGITPADYQALTEWLQEIATAASDVTEQYSQSGPASDRRSTRPHSAPREVRLGHLRQPYALLPWLRHGRSHGPGMPYSR
ncbi:HAD domain-containing protein [Actinomadura chibensis]|uniref:HAD domain-containing protein n=1 Tax=Actinomadura chibensis TaxID=392828 RepID=UPI000B2EBCC6|nr:HAD domain-containing protein [Actinomadura chibensis]